MAACLTPRLPCHAVVLLLFAREAAASPNSASKGCCGVPEALLSVFLRRQSAMEKSPWALAVLGAALGLALSLVLVSLYVASRAALRSYRRRQAHSTNLLREACDSDKARIIDGSVDSDEL